MLIRNHGYDSISLSFANNIKDPIGYRRFHPDDLMRLHNGLRESADGQCKVKNISYKLKNGKYYEEMRYDGWIKKNIRFSTSSKSSKLTFSLPKLKPVTNINGLDIKDLHETNINGLDIKDLNEQLFKDLSDDISFIIGRGKITRLDYCFDFCSFYPWDAYKHNIKNKNEYFTMNMVNDSTLYIQNNSREMCFYPQDQGRYKACPLSKEIISGIKNKYIERPNLFRAEFKLYEDVLDKISLPKRKYKGLILNDIMFHGNRTNKNYDSKNNRKILFELYKNLWKNAEYVDHIGVGNPSLFLLNLKDKATSADVQAHMFARDIYTYGLDYVRSSYPESKFTTPYHFREIQKSINKGLSILESSDISESYPYKTSDIQRLIKNTLDTIVPLKPKPLF